MNRKTVKRIIIALAVVGMEAAFGYAYLCGALTVTYGLSLPSADLTQAEFEQVLYLSRLPWVPFVAFHVFLVVLYLSGRFLDKRSGEQ
ncbi:hypothetical protein KAM338_47080 [Aeromonas caviae]|jgi:hypothetical protein|uniref:Uncharacterized protein n=3 Tax=Aeromonas TaxID=642 RepID=A0A6S5YM52_AERVE|nr:MULTISPECIES: hypothetical protein [Aeromonas]MBC8673224.1 hypothetical protein [Aeromonas hydrophila]MDX7722417.1 hypothetical protein [Aeromonas caviae]RCF44446.1 hypothetical protein C6C11_20350 [Aeromonas hydrophila]BBR37546.1 hypothetical protein WP3W19E03_00710 [Aeromonas veronii]BBU02733.1 hypothetical protein WP9W18E04_00720 [Aeromonas veronii]